MASEAGARMNAAPEHVQVSDVMTCDVCTSKNAPSDSVAAAGNKIVKVANVPAGVRIKRSLFADTVTVCPAVGDALCVAETTTGARLLIGALGSSFLNDVFDVIPEIALRS
jgi:hypothetical protein